MASAQTVLATVATRVFSVSHTVANAVTAIPLVTSKPAAAPDPEFKLVDLGDTSATFEWLNFQQGHSIGVRVEVEALTDSASSASPGNASFATLSVTRVDTDVPVEGAGERAVRIKRTGTFGTDVDPEFSFGRIVNGGVNRAVLRILQSSNGVGEHSCFEVEGTGTIASVAEALRASHFEAFMVSGVTEPTFRLNSYPDMQLQLGPGGQRCAIGALVRTGGNLVTVTTEDNHKFGTGDTVTISPGEANFAAGDFVVTVTGATTFTYSQAGSNVASSAVQYASAPVDIAIKRNGQKSLDVQLGEVSKLVLYEDTLTLQPGVSLNVGGAILGSVGAGLTAVAAGRLTQGWNKFTVPAAVFTAAATSQSKVVASLPAKGKVLEAILTVDTEFQLAASNLTLAVGLDTDVDALIEEHTPAAGTKGLVDADLGVKLIRATAVQGGARHSMTAAADITATMVSDSANLGNGSATSLSQGSATLWLLVDVAP